MFFISDYFNSVIVPLLFEAEFNRLSDHLRGVKNELFYEIKKGYPDRTLGTIATIE